MIYCKKNNPVFTGLSGGGMMLKILRSRIRITITEIEIKIIEWEVKKNKARTWKRFFKSGGLVR